MYHIAYHLWWDCTRNSCMSVYMSSRPGNGSGGSAGVLCVTWFIGTDTDNAVRFWSIRDLLFWINLNNCPIYVIISEKSSFVYWFSISIIADSLRHGSNPCDNYSFDDLIVRWPLTWLEAFLFVKVTSFNCHIVLRLKWTMPKLFFLSPAIKVLSHYDSVMR